MSKPPIAETNNRYAVCVGIDQYRTSARVGDLAFAEHDAQDMYQLFLRKGFSAENCCLLLGSQATIEAIEDALKIFVLDKPLRNDLVIFYFAGHGLPIGLNDDEDIESPSDVFLVAHNFNYQKMLEERGSWLSYKLRLQKLRTEFFENARSKKVLFILDSCNSGDFYGSKYRDGDALAHYYIDQSFGKMSAGKIVLSSCMPHQKAREDPDLLHGLFTYHLLQALEGRVRDAAERDGVITAGSLFSYLSKIMPLDQVPVKSGVEQGRFELLKYPEFDEEADSSTKHSNKGEHKHEEKKARLQAMFSDHTGFIHDRIESFVGRGQELAEIQERIAETMKTGGYVTITGQAGQGKSSIIAKLVEQYGQENVAYHFIPFNPGQDHQVNLLRNLMARLILKYDLSDLYVVSESRAALREYFPKVLTDLVAKGEREAIFLDGLDQLEEEYNGLRDLSFLPNNPPPGVVFVLGTRPNDTLRPLELLKPRHEYHLPNLSRQDFDLILHRRQVSLDKALADQFYEALQENALFLDLVAKELKEHGTFSPTRVIAELAHNPENLFSLAMSRLKRPPTEWREVIKPALGLMLAAREPLAEKHIRQILRVDADRLKEGLDRLGGLIANDGQQRYSLFHLKLKDFLRQDEAHPEKQYIFAKDEEEGWHQAIAVWCEQGDLSRIWEDVHDPTEQERHEYARKHYITHLYFAGKWKQLFDVLDTGTYGLAKISRDPSTRSFTQDLDLGRLAAGWEGWTIEEGMALLPHLWRYTLLRCSLTSRADNYSIEAFKALLFQKHYQKAIGLAELLTKPSYKVRVLCQIAGHLSRERGREMEGLQLLERAHELARSIEESNARTKVLCELGITFYDVKQWERADAVWGEAEEAAHMIENSEDRAEALRELGTALTEAERWERAETVVRMIGNSHLRAKALCKLGTSLTETQRSERAQTVWEEAEAEFYRLSQNIEGSSAKARILREFGVALIEAQQWERAEAVISTIKRRGIRGESQGKLGAALIEAQQWERAQAVISSIEERSVRVRVLRELGPAFIQGQQWEYAEVIIGKIESKFARAEALGKLGVALIQAQERERAAVIWRQAEVVISKIESKVARAEALGKLGIALIQAQERERGAVIWRQAEAFIHLIEQNEARAWVSEKLGIALTEAGQWEQAAVIWGEAEALIRGIKEESVRTQALRMLGIALIEARQWDQAEVVIHLIRDSDFRVEALRKLGIGLTKAGQWERAAMVWGEAEAVIHGIESKDARDRAIDELVTTLIEARQWERAKTIIRLIDDGDPRDWSLEALGVALAQAERWRRAEAIIHLIKNNEIRSRALRGLGMALIQRQQRERAKAVWKQAKQAIHLIKNNETRDRALQELATILAQAKEWERAEAAWVEAGTVIRRMKESKAIAWSFEELGRALIEARQWEQAEAIIRAIDQRSIRAQGLQKLEMALIEAQQWERAEAIIRLTEKSEVRADELGKLGVALTQAQEWERAEGVWDQAEAVIRTIESYSGRARALGKLGLVLVKAQQRERAASLRREAEATIRVIKDDDARARALEKLEESLIEAQEWERAEATIDEIEVFSSGTKDKALEKPGVTLAQAQGREQVEATWNEAEETVCTIETNDVRSEILCRLGIVLMGRVEAIIHTMWENNAKADALSKFGAVLARAHEWDRANAIWKEAEMTIHRIRERYNQIQALEKLALALIEAQQWERAEAIIRTIELDAFKTQALSRLGIALIEAEQWEQAEAVISTIDQNYIRSGVLRKLTETLIATYNYKQLLHMIQRMWRQAETRGYAIELLDLAASLLPLKPEIGMAFCEAFSWVDSFLQG